jgi:hypothetical protein
MRELVVGILLSERGELNRPSQETVPISSMVYVRTRECPWKYRVDSIDNFDVGISMSWIVQRQGAMTHYNRGRDQHMIGGESSADEESNRTDGELE